MAIIFKVLSDHIQAAKHLMLVTSVMNPRNSFSGDLTIGKQRFALHFTSVPERKVHVLHNCIALPATRALDGLARKGQFVIINKEDKNANCNLAGVVRKFRLAAFLYSLHFMQLFLVCLLTVQHFLNLSKLCPSSQDNGQKAKVFGKLVEASFMFESIFLDSLED